MNPRTIAAKPEYKITNKLLKISHNIIFPSKGHLKACIKLNFKLLNKINTLATNPPLDVLSFGDDEINRILDYLYPALANETQQHRTPMQE